MFFIYANWPLKNFRCFIQVHKTSGCYKGNADMYLETLNSQLEWWKDLIFPSAKTHFSHISQQDCPQRRERQLHPSSLPPSFRSPLPPRPWSCAAHLLPSIVRKRKHQLRPARSPPAPSTPVPGLQIHTSIPYGCLNVLRTWMKHLKKFKGQLA